MCIQFNAMSTQVRSCLMAHSSQASAVLTPKWVCMLHVSMSEETAKKYVSAGLLPLLSIKVFRAWLTICKARYRTKP